MRLPSLTTVIAYIRTMMGGAMPTPLAGHVHLELTTKPGNNNTASGTKPRKSPARPRTQKKPKAAQSTTAAAKNTKKKQKPAATAPSRKAAGSSTPTPVRKTRQHAK